MYSKRGRWIAFLLIFAMSVSILVLPAMAAAESEDTAQTDVVDEEVLTETETEPPLVDVSQTPEGTEAPQATEAPAPIQTPEATETPVPGSTSTPAPTPSEAGNEESSEETGGEEPEMTDGDAEEPEGYIVSYYVGQTLLSQETVKTGGSPADIPAVDGEGAAITGWLNDEGTFVAVAKAKIEADTAYYAWYAPALVDEHIRYINGTGNAMFSPNDKLTRAQAATILYNLLESKELGPYECTFTDVKSSAWYYTAVQTLASYKVLAGYSDGTFRPNQSISRAEFVTILVRMVGFEDGTISFSDVSPTGWAADYIATAASKGWVSGYGNNQFKPNNAITRAEAVKVMNRMLGREADSDKISSGTGILQYLDVTEKQWWYLDVMEASIGHEYTNASGSEVWTDYNVESCGLEAGVHSIGGSLYYVSKTTKQIVPVTKGVNELDGGLYLAQSDGYALCADFASKPGYVTYADGSQTQLTSGFNLIGGWTYIYWDSAKSSMQKMTANSVNKLGDYYYLSNSDGYTICTDIGYSAGIVQANGKRYISNGSYTIVTRDYNTLADTGSTSEVYENGKYIRTNPTVIDLKNHTYEYKGSMYYIKEDYSLAVDEWQGYLYFGTDGKYTSGDSTLDSYVYNAIGSVASNNSLSQRQKLLKAYYYLRGGEGKEAGTSSFGYLQTGEGYTRTRYNGQYQYAWAIKCAKRMFTDKKGMCYDWAAAYLYMARRLGFQSYLVVGNFMSDQSAAADARHCWCMIKWDSVWHISDVEIEWGYLQRWYTGTSTYWNLFDQAVGSEWLSFYQNPECAAIKYYFKDES